MTASMHRLVERLYVELCASSSEICTVCGIAAKSFCSKCKRHWYCGAGCQRAHWAFHKPLCGGAADAEVPMSGLTGLRVLLPCFPCAIATVFSAKQRQQAVPVVASMELM